MELEALLVGQLFLVAPRRKKIKKAGTVRELKLVVRQFEYLMAVFKTNLKK